MPYERQRRYYKRNNVTINSLRAIQREQWKEFDLCAKCGKERLEGVRARLCTKHYDEHLASLVVKREAARIAKDNTCMGGRKQTVGQPWKGSDEMLPKDDD